ncbi:hypothetical protein ColLi_00344 [Colletotrichum liriopes]|uniref:Uncharacterized protein n=1 Tax=Colletotrichum liriopes TaxID=708192 RepID=A0AA37GAV5_9PEZI|nr:hypothetical protein ColLi_00344 [Colletotrichum liriopes]
MSSVNGLSATAEASAWTQDGRTSLRMYCEKRSSNASKHARAPASKHTFDNTHNNKFTNSNKCSWPPATMKTTSCPPTARPTPSASTPRASIRPPYSTTSMAAR